MPSPIETIIRHVPDDLTWTDDNRHPVRVQAFGDGSVLITSGEAAVYVSLWRMEAFSHWLDEVRGIRTMPDPHGLTAGRETLQQIIRSSGIPGDLAMVWLYDALMAFQAAGLTVDEIMREVRETTPALVEAWVEVVRQRRIMREEIRNATREEAPDSRT